MQNIAIIECAGGGQRRILIFIHRKFGTETQQRKHKYKQDTIQNTTIESITAVYL